MATLTPNRDAVERMIKRREASGELDALTEPRAVAIRDISAAALNASLRWLADSTDRGDDPSGAVCTVADALANVVVSMAITYGGDDKPGLVAKITQRIEQMAALGLDPPPGSKVFATRELADNTSGRA